MRDILQISQRTGIDNVTTGISGRFPAHRPQPHAAIEGKMAGLDQTILQAPAIPPLLLNINIGPIDPVIAVASDS